MFTKVVPEVGKMTTIENWNAHYNAEKTYRHIRVFIGKNKMHLLFTDNDIEKAIHRTQKNREDIQEQIPEDKTIPTPTLWWALYSSVVTVGLVSALLARFLGY